MLDVDFMHKTIKLFPLWLRSQPIKKLFGCNRFHFNELQLREEEKSRPSALSISKYITPCFSEVESNELSVNSRDERPKFEIKSKQIKQRQGKKVIFLIKDLYRLGSIILMGKMILVEDVSSFEESLTRIL